MSEAAHRGPTNGAPRPSTGRVAAAGAAPPTRADIFNDPEEYAALLEAFEPKNTIAAAAVSAFASALAFATHRALTGSWSRLGVAGAIATLVMLAIANGLTLATRRPLVERRRDRFWHTLTVQGAAHLTWLYAVCLLVGEFFSVLGLAALLAWIFNDTRYLYDSALLRRQYLAPALVIDGVIALASAVRSDLVARVVPTQRALVVFGAVQLGLVVLTQVLIMFVGRQNRERAARAREMRDLNQQLAVYRKEREVLERAARLMTSGLASVKFAHDVASPISALDGALNMARKLGRRELDAAKASERDRARFEDTFELAERALERIRTMADAHATALRRRDPVEPVAVDALLDRAWREALTTLETHGERDVAAPARALEPGSVYVTDGHASTLANLLTNGALQGPSTSLEVRGERCDQWFYRVTIRDHGVAPETREQALSLIERSLSLDAEPSEREVPRRYRGYGIALGIARVLLVRYNGWLSARAPEEGAGVVFCVVLPAAAPESIPAEFNKPEVHAQA